MFDSFQRRIHYLRLSVTDRCNFRCAYCMPAAGVELKRRAEILSLEELAELARVAVDLGFDKIRLTGGEPLVRRGILTLVRQIGAIPGLAEFALTTNGARLAPLAAELRAAGLQRVNISLDSVDPARFHAITRGGELAETLAGIAAAQAVGFAPVKLNCVIEQSPEEPDARAVAAFGRERGLEVRFIRRMNTAKGEFWRVIGGDGGDCPRCNRLRVTCDGRLFPCLFDNLNFSVRELGPRAALLAAIAAKPAAGRHSANQFHALGG